MTASVSGVVMTCDSARTNVGLRLATASRLVVFGSGSTWNVSIDVQRLYEKRGGWRCSQSRHDGRSIASETDPERWSHKRGTVKRLFFFA